jgi:two-component system OmpR family sensor kinase
MARQNLFRILLPLGLGLTGGILLLEVSVDRSHQIFPQDSEILFLLLGMGLIMFTTMLLIFREMMERSRLQRIEQAREDAMAEHRRFLRRLDHELKNPLTAFRAGLGSLAITDTEPARQQIVQTLDAEARRLSRLITDLRKLAELETLPLDVNVIDMMAFLGDIQALYEENMAQSDRLFTLEMPNLPDPRPTIIGDQDLLLLAVHNLLDNAIKYTHPGDQIRLQVRVDEDDFILNVVDTGIGIPQDEVPLVWEELYRGQETKDIPGYGIGLALVRAIIDRHYGKTSLVSRPNQGTTVTLRLPLN